MGLYAAVRFMLLGDCTLGIFDQRWLFTWNIFPCFFVSRLDRSNLCPQQRDLSTEFPHDTAPRTLLFVQAWCSLLPLQLPYRKNFDLQLGALCCCVTSSRITAFERIFWTEMGRARCQDSLLKFSRLKKTFHANHFIGRIKLRAPSTQETW